MRRKNWELKGIFWIITLLFVGFLAAPILLLLGKLGRLLRQRPLQIRQLSRLFVQLGRLLIQLSLTGIQRALCLELLGLLIQLLRIVFLSLHQTYRHNQHKQKEQP